MAAAANTATLKKLHTEARRDSKFIKKKLQRQQEPGHVSRGSKDKVKREGKGEGDVEIGQGLLRRDSSQGGGGPKMISAACFDMNNTNRLYLGRNPTCFSVAQDNQDRSCSG